MRVYERDKAQARIYIAMNSTTVLLRFGPNGTPFSPGSPGDHPPIRNRRIAFSHRSLTLMAYVADGDNFEKNFNDAGRRLDGGSVPFAGQ